MQKRAVWLLTFLMSLPVVAAQEASSPFGQLKKVWEAIANVIGLSFVETSDQLAAVIRIFVFVIVYAVLHAIFKHTLEKKAGATTGIFDHKTTNVITIAIAVFVALILPMEFLVKGSFMLVAILGLGTLILLYYIIHTLSSELSTGWAAFMRTLTLCLFLLVVNWIGNVGESTQAITIGGVDLRTLVSANQVLKILTDIQGWVITILWIAIIVNFILWIARAGQTRIGSAAGMRDWTRENLPTVGTGLSGVSKLASYLPWINKAEKAKRIIRDIQTNVQLWKKAINDDELSGLDGAGTTFLNLLTTLRVQDEDILKRRVDDTTLAKDKKLKDLFGELEEEENLIIALYKLNVEKMLDDLASTLPPAGKISKNSKRDAKALLDDALTLLDRIEKLNQQETRIATS